MTDDDMGTELVRFDGSPIYESDIRVDNLQNLYWRTATRELIAVPRLKDKHLRNIALMLMGFGYQEFLASDRLKILWLTALRMEWERRPKMQKAHSMWRLDNGRLRLEK